MTIAEDVIQTALGLPVEDRAALAEQLTGAIAFQNRSDWIGIVCGEGEQLVREAENESLRMGILSGRYVVEFRSPWAGGKQESDLRRRILDFVGATANIATTR